jgi:hypothetical protein
MTPRDHRLIAQAIQKKLRPTPGQRVNAAYLGFCAGLGAMRLQLFGVFLVMFTLKLAHVLNASWWLVTLPLTGPLALAVGLPLAFAVCALAVALVALVAYGFVRLFKFVSSPFRRKPLKLS